MDRALQMFPTGISSAAYHMLHDWSMSFRDAEEAKTTLFTALISDRVGLHSLAERFLR